MLPCTPWFAVAQGIINGIRTSNLKTQIIVGGDGWSSGEFWPLYSDNLKELNDPSNNMTFEAHVYFDNNSSGRCTESYDDEGGNPNNGIERVTPFLMGQFLINLKLKITKSDYLFCFTNGIG